MYKQCIPYLSSIFSKLCSNKTIKQSHYGFKAYPCSNILIPLVNLTIYASILKLKSCFLKFNAKKKGGKIVLPLLLLFKVGRAIAPSSFAHEVVLVKFELDSYGAS